ncbi:hypothetical protein [Sphingomonas sp. IW22]|uniref:hypothetical protein n=1 Tax=Sphingomonas sp. IW22 TaxID=3242489 RepID=UPI003521E451
MRIVIYNAGGFGRELLRAALHIAGQIEVVFASDDCEQVGALVNGVAIVSASSLRSDDRCALAVNDPAEAQAGSTLS